MRINRKLVSKHIRHDDVDPYVELGDVTKGLIPIAIAIIIVLAGLMVLFGAYHAVSWLSGKHERETKICDNLAGKKSHYIYNDASDKCSVSGVPTPYPL